MALIRCLLFFFALYTKFGMEVLLKEDESAAVSFTSTPITSIDNTAMHILRKTQGKTNRVTCSSNPSITMDYDMTNSNNSSDSKRDSRLFLEDSGYLFLQLHAPKPSANITITFSKGISLIKEKPLSDMDYEINKGESSTNLTIHHSKDPTITPIKLFVFFYSINPPKDGASRTFIEEIYIDAKSLNAKCAIEYFKDTPERESISLNVTSDNMHTSKAIIFTVEAKKLVPAGNYYISIMKMEDDFSWTSLLCNQIIGSYSTDPIALNDCSGVGLIDCPFYYQAELFYITTEDKNCPEAGYFSSSNVVLFPNTTYDPPEPSPEPLPEPGGTLTASTVVRDNTELIIVMTVTCVVGAGLIAVVIYCTVRVYLRMKAKENEVNQLKEEQQKKEKDVSVDKKSFFEEKEVEIHSKTSLE